MTNRVHMQEAAVCSLLCMFYVHLVTVVKEKKLIKIHKISNFKMQFCKFISVLILQQLHNCNLTHNSGRVTQICVFNTVKLGTSASSP